MIPATKAWHLRQDGKAFPVNVHLYTMEDEDLSSEAEVASFIIKTNSKDIDLAKYVLDAWMAILIEDEVEPGVDADDINSTISRMIKEYGPVGYQDAYVLNENELIDIHIGLNNYNDYETLHTFLDNVMSKISDIQTAIKQSINQQFCRVRFGGKYDSESGNNGIWFRISSTGYNWDNTIYMFVTDMKRKLNIQTITICRDAESDLGFMNNAGGDNFYVSKDRTVYRNMPVDEFLSEEHESSPVFASSELNSGVIHVIRNELKKGDTLERIYACLQSSGVDAGKFYNRRSLWRSLISTELQLCTVSFKER